MEIKDLVKIGIMVEDMVVEGDGMIVGGEEEIVVEEIVDIGGMVEEEVEVEGEDIESMKMFSSNSYMSSRFNFKVDLLNFLLIDL